jgi:Flp pilus assembly protein CpaB
LRGYKKLLSLAILCGLLAGIMFYYNNVKLPRVEKETEVRLRKVLDLNAMPKTKVAVIIDKNGITKYTELTQKILKEKIKFVEVPTKYIAEGTITDQNYMVGKIAKEDLRYGEQVSLESLSSEKKWFGEFQRLKEYAVSSIVADEVKSGNIIDLLVSYGDGTYDLVVEKLKVIKLITEIDGQINKKAVDNSTGEMQNVKPSGTYKYTLILAVDEEQYRDLELAKTLGKLEARLYLDESQPASKKTFDYKTEINKVKVLSKVGE